MPPVSKKKNKELLAPNASKQNKSNGENQTVISGQLQKQINNRKAIKKRKLYTRGVVLIKNLPHGFFEEQLRKYFEQFGSVTRIRLVRSRLTGNSKGFAFIEFAVPEVAKIAAETMDNYLMFQKIVKAIYIPPEDRKYNYFKTKVHKVINKAGKEIFISGKTKHIHNEMKTYNNWNDETIKKRNLSNLKKLNKLKKKYPHIDFDKLTLGFGAATNSNGSDVEVNKEECVKNDSVDNEENISESSENSDSPKCGSLLLIKKRKKASGGNSKNLKNEKVSNKKSGKTTDKSTKLSPTVSQNRKFNGVKKMPESEASSCENKNNSVKINEKKNIGKVREQVIKEKAPSGGIQKAKNKQMKSKKEKNKFSEKLKSLAEGTLKEMTTDVNKSKVSKSTKGASKKVKK